MPDIVLTREHCGLASRHQVAPLLYGIVEGGRHLAPPDVVEELRESYLASKMRRKAALRVLDAVGERFSESGLGWMVFKGTTQAAQIYSDPAWRIPPTSISWYPRISSAMRWMRWSRWDLWPVIHRCPSGGHCAA